MSNNYYAVAYGHNIGIYDNWEECKKNIEGITNPIYKKFTNEEDAKKFIDDYVNTIYIYTDGACINNGTKNAKAGIGIFIAKDDERNVSRELEGDNLTNNIAELVAVIEAINIIKKIDIKNKVIVTDSEYVIKCATYYGEKLSKNEWKTSNNKIPPNVSLVKKLYLLTNKYNIKYQHIKAHTYNKDRHSIGNYYADKLANESISNTLIPEKSGVVDNINKIYLNVPYSKKDDAKSKGARWDAKCKKWYIYDNNSNKKELIEIYK